MTFNIARQPLVPAFLTLAALVVAAVWSLAHADVMPAGETAQAVATALQPVLLPESYLLQFQTTCPVGALWIASFLILYSGVLVGRMTVRYNLFSVGSCLSIPLFGLGTVAFLPADAYLQTLVAVTLLSLAVKNLCRGFCNGYGFDGLFRGGLYLGLIPLVEPAAAAIVLLLPVAVLLFNRTLREAAVAFFGLLLPAFALCYVNWGMGGDFLAPLIAGSRSFVCGSWLDFFRATPLPKLALLGGFVLLNLFALLFFISDMYVAGVKPRLILIFAGCLLLLSVVQLAVPAASQGLVVLFAVPFAILLPVMFVRIHPLFSLLIYLLLFASVGITLIMQ